MHRLIWFIEVSFHWHKQRNTMQDCLTIKSVISLIALSNAHKVVYGTFSIENQQEDGIFQLKYQQNISS